jgi:hypothetical protein
MSSDDSLSPRPTPEVFPLRRLLVDLVITGGVFVFFSIILRPHVPSNDNFWITVWACLSALCMSGVFFIALQMFRTVLHDPKANPPKDGGDHHP